MMGTKADQYNPYKEESKNPNKTGKFVFFSLVTLGLVRWGRQYGFKIVSKFGLHEMATHSTICEKMPSDKK